jgi:hypothetical protein
VIARGGNRSAAEMEELDFCQNLPQIASALPSITLQDSAESNNPHPA